MRHQLLGMMANKNHEVVTTWRNVCRVHNGIYFLKHGTATKVI